MDKAVRQDAGGVHGIYSGTKETTQQVTLQPISLTYSTIYPALNDSIRYPPR